MLVVCWLVKHLLVFEQGLVGPEPLAVALAFDHDLVAGLACRSRALLRSIGSSNRPSPSSTEWSEVITKLAVRWRAMTS